MVVGRVGGRTRIVDLGCRAPLAVLRGHYLDPEAEDMLSVMIASPSGGVLQGDRLLIEIEVRTGARLHLETQSATRLYRMPDAPARLETLFRLDADAYLEYVPDPIVPFAGSNVVSSTRAVVHPDAALILGEVVGPGRAARGEIHAMTRFESVTEVERPDGTLVFADATVLQPGEDLAGPGMLGGHAALGSLYVLATGVDSTILRESLEGAALPTSAYWGVSSLPGAAGAWFRVLTPDVGSARATVGTAHDAAHLAILGSGLPRSRRL